MASKKRRSYRAYAPGSVQKKVNSLLRHAISEMRDTPGRRTRPAGCPFAHQWLLQARDLVRSQHGTRTGYASSPLARQYERVQKVYKAKCRR